MKFDDNFNVIHKEYLIDQAKLEEKQEVMVNQGKAAMNLDFSDIKVLLIGDFMVDHYIIGGPPTECLQKHQFL